LCSRRPPVFLSQFCLVTFILDRRQDLLNAQHLLVKLDYQLVTRFSFRCDSYAIFALRKRRLLETTNTLLKAIAPAASMGFRYPRAAAGISTTL
jgi:hypothetical protein